MEERVLSEKESLALISEMINKAKGHYYESGSSALLWGFSNIVCFTLAYLMATVDGFNFPFNPFYLMIITGILQIYFHRRDRKIKISVSYTDEAHSYVWIAFGISIVVLTVAGGMSDIGYLVMPLLLLLFAIPTFISGCIKKFKPLYYRSLRLLDIIGDLFFLQDKRSLFVSRLRSAFRLGYSRIYFKK